MLADLTRHAASGDLSREQVAHAMELLLDASVGEDAKAGFLRAWAQRGETPAELAACAEVLLPRAVDPGLQGSWQGRPLLDCSGTGGGGLGLVNVSTGIVFVLAALGVPVVKHGNRGLTKKSGSADVLEALGIRIDLPPEKLPACVDEVGAAFLFAPAFYRSFAALAPVRRRLGAEGRRTVFNLLGPLLNPARPDARLVGVFSDGHVHLYEAALRALGCPRFAVVCGVDGLTMKKIGEASANGETLISASKPGPGGLSSFVLPMKSDPAGLDSMMVADAAASARRLTAILSGAEKSGLARETVVINAAVAAWAQGTAASIEEGRALAAEALDSGRALTVLRQWRTFSEKA